MIEFTLLSTQQVDLSVVPRLGTISFWATNRLASWGRVLASPRLIADVELAISWQLIAKNHNFCHENSKKLEKNGKNLNENSQKQCFLAINCQLIAKRTVGDYSSISKSIIASPRLVIWQ